VDVLVVGVRLFDLAGKTVNREVHLAEPDRLCDLVLAKEAQLLERVLFVILQKMGSLDEHATRSASGVEDPAMKRLDDVLDQLDDGCGGEKLSHLSSPHSWRTCRRSTGKCRRRGRRQHPEPTTVS